MRVDPVCGAASRVVPGDEVEGVLSGGDDMFAGGYIDYYGLDLSDSATIHLELTSNELDPLLVLFRIPGRVGEQAFDTLGAPAGQLETAAIRRRVAPGCHLIGASSWQDRTTGAYTLRADTIAALPEDG